MWHDRMNLKRRSTKSARKLKLDKKSHLHTRKISLTQDPKKLIYNKIDVTNLMFVKLDVFEKLIL